MRPANSPLTSVDRRLSFLISVVLLFGAVKVNVNFKSSMNFLISISIFCDVPKRTAYVGN
jgi:hypothetical protein